ncbi:unnamed protein product [Parascedosporium putredinis]|uniref:Ankyrin repeat protein n=1 Tax=Parascedosporium putredinis TaxID=1442378 RepID=A0A9P1MA71_9PEZI|nr:unnamed protein product [Parascedosporium putredinis]CAI7996925.1 unnamed protein product [Parascedosporium putredinis]
MEELCRKDGLDVNLQDSQGRTPLSWAAQHGNVDCVQVLLDKGVAPDTPDKKRRTPLSWAAEHGNVDCVQVLLDKGVAPDTPDEKCRTPLSWAAEKGQVGVIGVLLCLGERRPKRDGGLDTDDERTAREATRKSQKRKIEVGVDVNSSDTDKNWTPLWYAAIYQRLEAFDALLAAGANPSLTDSKGRTLQKVLQTRDRPHSPVADAEPIPHLTDIDGGTRKDVVRDPEADDKLPSQGLTKYHQILERLKFPGSWHKQNQDLNVAQGDAAPEDDGKGTRETAATQFRQQDEQQVNELPNDRDSHGRRSGMVLFMPYLHWELEEEYNKLQDIMKETKTILYMSKNSKHSKDSRNSKDSRDSKAKEAHTARMKTALGDARLCSTQKLYWRYLEEDHPLHPRRTLDQFYYHTLSDTKERDQDQTCVRYFNKKKGDLEGQTFELRRVLTMVDQLWMWILPACGTAPPTVITAFPQRSDRMACKDPKRMPALVSNIVDILRDILRGPLPCPSVEELTEIIATECSRIYFDTMSNRHELTQFLQIYTTSIGDIVG